MLKWSIRDCARYDDRTAPTAGGRGTVNGQFGGHLRDSATRATKPQSPDYRGAGTSYRDADRSAGCKRGSTSGRLPRRSFVPGSAGTSPRLS
jgi:hypothetical protein